MQQEMRRSRKDIPCSQCPTCRGDISRPIPLFFLPFVKAEIGVNLKGFSERQPFGISCEYQELDKRKEEEKENDIEHEIHEDGCCSSLVTYTLQELSIEDVGPYPIGMDERGKEEMFDYVVRSVYQPGNYCWTHMHIRWREMFREMKKKYQQFVKRNKKVEG